MIKPANMCEINYAGVCEIGNGFFAGQKVKKVQNSYLIGGFSRLHFLEIYVSFLIMDGERNMP